VGVFLPGGARIPYGNPVYDPIWRAAAEFGLPVVVHVHYEGIGISGPVTAAGHPDFYLEYHALLGASLQGHLASVLCHGIFERYPSVRMVLMEGGLAGYPGLLWRLDTNWKACRAETPYCLRPPSEYVWDHVRFTTQPLEEPADARQLQNILEPLRPWQTLCFASDYPHWDFDEPNLTLRALPSEWHPPILGANAMALYGLALPEVSRR
jgi:predicted TIM-barrel fold metal-dependent hydrolase